MKCDRWESILSTDRELAANNLDSQNLRYSNARLQIGRRVIPNRSTCEYFAHVEAAPDSLGWLQTRRTER